MILDQPQSDHHGMLSLYSFHRSLFVFSQTQSSPFKLTRQFAEYRSVVWTSPALRNEI